jgi:hypothetical protein
MKTLTGSCKSEICSSTKIQGLVKGEIRTRERERGEIFKASMLVCLTYFFIVILALIIFFNVTKYFFIY